MSRRTNINVSVTKDLEIIERALLFHTRKEYLRKAEMLNDGDIFCYLNSKKSFLVTPEGPVEVMRCASSFYATEPVWITVSIDQFIAFTEDVILIQSLGKSEYETVLASKTAEVWS